MEDPLPFLLLLLFLILASAFLTLLKTALACSRRSRLQALAEEGKHAYGKVLKVFERLGRYLSALRIGIIFLELLTGVLAALGLPESMRSLFAGGMGALPAVEVLIFTAGLLAVFYLLGEVIPRTIGRSAPEAVAAAFLPCITIMGVLTFPLVTLGAWISGLAEKALPRGGPGNSGITEDELKMALKEGEKSGIVESEERTMVEGVFYLGDRPAGTFMIHRSELRWLDINAGAGEARTAAEGKGENRIIPVVEGGLDGVAGAVSVEDLLMALLDGSWPGLRALMKPPFFIPETMPALKAFEAFKKAEANEVFVMDEYGGFAGILSIRNLIGEIVGELSSPRNREEAIILQEDGAWLADGSLNIDNAAGALGLHGLGGEHGEYHTLAGFILDLAGEIPKTGAFFDYHGFRFRIAGMDGNRIDKVHISRLEAPE
ncbi:MAG: hemolysin family protein [Treponema sp.]|jgi:putative hemolysin|nr:hemolysin family protein [Treponema sp.]